jgi:lipoate---protein ligase
MKQSPRSVLNVGISSTVSCTMPYTPYALGGEDPLEHLALENILLATRQEEQAFLLFYVNKPSVIIGRNQNPWREAAPDAQVPIYRRGSGGGTVYHDNGNLNWAFIVPRRLHDQGGELEAIALGISACGTAVAPGARGGIYCTRSTGYDGMKVSGTARRFAPDSVLHHGTALVRADLHHMRACLGGIETHDDHSIPSVPATAVNLCELRPQLTVGHVIETLSRCITGESPRELPAGFVDSQRLEEEKAVLSGQAWLYGSTPPFAVFVDTPRFRIELRIRAGLVDSISVSGSTSSPTGNNSGSGGRVELALAHVPGKPFSLGMRESIRLLAERAVG